MASDAIEMKSVDGWFELKFNRPEKKNAITADMYQLLADGIQQAEEDDSIRVIAIVGNEQSFCAGNDLKDFVDNPPQEDNSPVWQFLSRIASAKKPVIAGVNGPAIGIGTTLLLHCDLVVAAQSAVFALPFTALGLCPEAGSSLLLPKLVGQKKASEWLLLGSRFDAATAAEYGLVNRVCETASEVAQQLEQWKTALVQLPVAAVAATKQLIKQPDSAEVLAQIEQEGKIFKQLLLTDDAKAAFNAFLKR